MPMLPASATWPTLPASALTNALPPKSYDFSYVGPAAARRLSGYKASLSAIAPTPPHASQSAQPSHGADHGGDALADRRAVDAERCQVPERQRFLMDDVQPAQGIGRFVIEREGNDPVPQRQNAPCQFDRAGPGVE